MPDFFFFLQYYESITKRVNCADLFSNLNLDSSSEFEQPPKEIPTFLWVLSGSGVDL